MTQNSNNQDFSNDSDGFTLGGGTTERKLSVTGADVTLTGSGTAVITLPATTTTLMGRDTTDTVTGKSIDGADNTITNIGPSSLSTGAQADYVAAVQSVTSASAYTDLATVGPSVTVTIGSNGLALVSIYSYLSNSSSGYTGMGFVVSGANTIAADDTSAIFNIGTNGNRFGATFLLTGLSAGSTTFKAVYKGNNTATFSSRRIAVVPL